MNFLVDMNLAPRWCHEFVSRGHQAVHWSEVGTLGAPDAELMSWAREKGHVVFTHDLDFGTALALTHVGGPSVIQVRHAEPLPEVVGPQIFAAITQYQAQLEQGALLTIDPARNRVRLLPIGRA